jgi:hypothetical protein
MHPMHSAIHYEIAKAQIATLHAQGRRDALARGAYRARHAQRQKPEHSAHTLPTVRVLARISEASADSVPLNARCDALGIRREGET